MGLLHGVLAAPSTSSAAGASRSPGLAFSAAASANKRRRPPSAKRSGSGSVVTVTSCDEAHDNIVEWNDSPSEASREERVGFSVRAFASSDCWGRRPLLIRGAFDPDPLLGHAWPSWEEVVEIAGDVDSESRIISHIPGDLASFELRWGPLTERDVRDWLSKSPTSSSASDARTTIIAGGGGGGRRRTLVVNDVDRYHPPLADWMYETFDFLPNWRMDDGQISLAETGGGIGPHVDDYDVFLIQMAGTRTWRVGRRKIGVREERDRTIDGLDVRVLGDRDFDHDHDHDEEEEEGVRGGSDELIIARPGDLLYLPPRVSHCGTATSSDCMTLSVGCRAPSASDLVSKLAERLSSSTEDFAVRRYADPDLLRGTTVDGASSGTASPGELTSDAKERARRLVRESLTSMIDDDEWWDEFFGRYATEQKRARGEYPIPLEDTPREGGGGGDSNTNATAHEWVDARSTVLGVLDGRGVLYQAEGIAFAHSSVHSKAHRGRTSRRFFVNGEMWQSECQSEHETNSLTRLFRVVSNHRRLDRSLLLGLDENDGQKAQRDELSPDATSFLEDLVSAGILYGSSE